MATNTLTLTHIADKVNRQAERLMMMKELTRLAIESLPCSTDSDVPLALLNGVQEILSVDAENMYRLFESLGSKAEHASLIEVAHA